MKITLDNFHVVFKYAYTMNVIELDHHNYAYCIASYILTKWLTNSLFCILWRIREITTHCSSLTVDNVATYEIFTIKNVANYSTWTAWFSTGSYIIGNRGQGGLCLLILLSLHRNIIFTIETYIYTVSW